LSGDYRSSPAATRIPGGSEAQNGATPEFVAICVYPDILPPIVFIGTIYGLAILLLSMCVSHDVLQMGALVLALSSTIFAPIGYAFLEGLKIHLYGRLAHSIEAGLEGAV
jgi:hypothetical protein